MKDLKKQVLLLNLSFLIEDPETPDNIKKQMKSLVTSLLSKDDKSIKEKIDELPDGEDLGVKSPYNLLAQLAPIKIDKYLAGVELEEMIELSDNVNHEFIDRVVKASETQPDTRLDILEIEEGGKIERLIKKYKGGIPEGEALFNVITRNGVTKDALNDFKTLVLKGRSANLV